MAAVASPPPPPAPVAKVSRYRSQRQPHQTPDEPPASPPPSQPPLPSPHDDAFARSKSRYRRGPSTNATRPATARDQDRVDVVPRPSSNQVPAANTTSHSISTNQQRKPSPPTQSGARESSRATNVHNGGYEKAPARQEPRQRYGTQRRRDESSQSPASPTGDAFPTKSTAVRPTTKPVIHDGPPTSGQIRATKSMSALPHYSDGDDNAGCFGLFKRKRVDAVPEAEKLPPSRSVENKQPKTIKPGGGGIVPGIDAPVSAVNAGDRQVLVECGKTKTLFPVTPETTSVDIIKRAIICIAEPINAKSAVLVESFGTVGIQRPLRRYERIRDVLNSWDSDNQNTLILIEPGTGSSEAELSVSGAPKAKPEDRTRLLFFSQKPGKWDKRFITLTSEGQITAQKDLDKPKDAFNVCHLSDFDIYSPTQEKSRKKIRPPKKFCFAIKSQQKTSMFESTQDFVHFFCTNDRPTADEFYDAVQGWRSWYLVNVMGEGRKPKTPPEKTALEKEVKHGVAHKPVNSMDSAYHLGSFKPLIDLDQFDNKRGESRRSAEPTSPVAAGFTKSSSQFDTTVSPERRTSRMRKQNPPLSAGNKMQLAEDEPLANLARTSSINRPHRSADGEFQANSLLGRTYSQRQKDRSESETQKASPFTNGPNLLNGGYDSREEEYTGRRSPDIGLKRTHSSRVQHAHKPTNSGDLQRSDSRARGGVLKPLVDLTPQYREPPQHSKKGRGYNPENLGPGGLIDAATSPDDPLGIPPSTDWRARNTSGGPTNAYNQTTTLSRHGTNSRSTRRPATSGFTGEGLLAGSQAGWGGGDRGRGYIDGSRATGRLVDLSEPSKFVQGSLLNQVEREQGIPAPVVDRSRED